MGTCGSSSVQSCLTGSARLCSKHDGTARARSNAQHNSLMGRTRKSSGTTKRSKMNCPTEELHANPCNAINAATTHLPATNNCPIPAFSEALGMHVLALGYLKIFCHIGGLRTLPSEELLDFVCIGFLLISFSSFSICPQNLASNWLRSIFVSQPPKFFSNM